MIDVLAGDLPSLGSSADNKFNPDIIRDPGPLGTPDPQDPASNVATLCADPRFNFAVGWPRMAFFINCALGKRHHTLVGLRRSLADVLSPKYVNKV
jgi:hypothetical protein